MATVFGMGPLISVTVTQEQIAITSDRYTPNEQWRHTDTQGHQHYYDRGYPTLILMVDAVHWCDGREGAFDHDPHEQVDASHYECKICGQTIEPKLDPPMTPKYIPGRIDAEAEGVRSDGSVIRWSLNADEYETWLAGMAYEGAQRMIDNVPPDRIASRSFSSH